MPFHLKIASGKFPNINKDENFRRFNNLAYMHTNVSTETAQSAL